MRKKANKRNAIITYPKVAYLVYMLLMKKDKTNILFPLEDIFTSFEKIKLYAEKFLKNIPGDDFFVPPAPIVFPLRLTSNIRLNHKQDETTPLQFTKADRINNFLKPLENFQFYQLLVIPSIDGPLIRRHAAYCFSINAPRKEISLFIESTKLGLVKNVRNAALYIFEEPLRFELEENNKVKIVTPSSQKK